MQELAREPRTIIIYESPRRVTKTLEQICELFGADRQVSACREISKIHEESVRGTAQEVLQHFIVNEPRGEFVIIIAGATDSIEGTNTADETDSFCTKGNSDKREKHESKYQRKLRQRNNEE